MSKPRIFCFINSGKDTDWVIAMAMAEDGVVLAKHVSSSDIFAMMDSGFAEMPDSPIIEMEWGPNYAKRKRFEEHYPDGYNLEWVDDPKNHDGLMKAYELNQKMHEHSLSED